jgi:hypothetical protein
MPRQPLTNRPESQRALSTLLTLALLLAGLATTAANAQSEEDDSGKPAKLFSSGTSLDITITAPWSEIQKQKKNQNPYPAKLDYLDEAGQPVSLDLTVGRRGIKRQEVCPFPPIRLTFVKEAVANTTFRGNDELKLVTHCNKAAKFDQYYVLEMLAYHMYNLLTDYSYRVKPLQVTYIDSKNGKPVDTRFGFLIESNGDMAKRNGLRKLDIPKINHKRLEAKSTALLTLFQYMIANPDWAASMGHDPAKCCHNVKLIGPDPFLDTDFAIPVAYDFDSAGLVDPEYAAPPEGLPIKSVTQRLYRGYCVHNGQLEAARQKTLEQEGAIMALIQNESRLNDNSKNKTLKFMAKYFEIVKDPGQFQKNVVAECRGTK